MEFFYPYRFVQSFKVENEGRLQSKRLYTFKSVKSNQWYWVWVELYDYHVYAIKFHLKSLRFSPHKYNLLTNTYEPRKIVHTCINIMLEVYQQDDRASFGFIGSNLVEEDINNTKRFRFYRRIMATYFSEKHFIHLENEKKSTYLMLNKIELTNNSNLLQNIESAFVEQYRYFE